MLLDNPWFFKLWVKIGGLSDHLLIILEISSSKKRPSYPMKFNQDWLKEKDYQKLVEEKWIHLNEESETPLMHQFVENISRIKHATISWENAYKKNQSTMLREVESNLRFSLLKEKQQFDGRRRRLASIVTEEKTGNASEQRIQMETKK
jgi:hypothetical protein